MCEGKDFSLPAEEQRVLELWARLDVFHEQLHRTEGGEEFIFYDGPPFATGLPHYGHILAGTIKDVVTRHQSMRGRHVMRRFGWDCHGLPVEFEIDKLIGITNRQQVLDLGIGNCNETCIVTKYVTEWEVVVTRTGRWIDFKARPWTSTSWRASDGSSASSVTRTPSTRASSWCEQQLDKKELEQKLKKDQKAREKEEKKQKASQRETARLQVLLWCA